MSKTGKVVKVVIITGAIIGTVGYLGGASNTSTIVHTAAAGTGWGVGVGISSVPAAVAGFQSGFSTNGKAALPNAGNPAGKPASLKVPNCTAKQKQAAPSVCA